MTVSGGRVRRPRRRAPWLLLQFQGISVLSVRGSRKDRGAPSARLLDFIGYVDSAA
jgi:hypothetical protein